MKNVRKSHLDNDAGTPDDLPSLSLLVDFAETGPFAEFLVVVDAQERNVVLRAERNHQLFVHRLVAVLREDTHQRLPSANYIKFLFRFHGNRSRVFF